MKYPRSRLAQIYSSRPILLLALLLLHGCAQFTTPKPVPISADWAGHQAQVLAFDHWQAAGKLGVKVPNDGGSANLRWQQRAADYQIDLNGPFGQGKLTITGTPGKVTLVEANNPPQSAATAEALILKTTGWNIPVTQLAFWVRGLPDPKLKIAHFEPNAQGLLAELQQGGWKISYSDYTNLTTTDNTIALPGRIVAEYKDVRLTLVIREWQPLDNRQTGAQ